MEEQTTATKTQVVASLRPLYPLAALLQLVNLPRSTFYDRLKRNQKPDKYWQLKAFIQQTFHASMQTYGYRWIHLCALKAGFKCAPMTINKLMGELDLAVMVYSRHSSNYHSYKGQLGTVNDNLLKQQFQATEPYTVLHTDITQVRLANQHWGYISVVLDEASREVIGAVVSQSANKQHLSDTLDMLQHNLPAGVTPIIHSDQGWQYQTALYQQRVQAMGLTASMSRKGNCHDNAPMESFFSLMKRERLNRQSIVDLAALVKMVQKYIERISLNKNGLTPIEYRQQRLTA
ncbi:IS3 family transposase [Bombilactobacillus bombi]|uniref:IS3 family transposase n=1 Tax=Bombilactobacillus bombi TaxID=1303590 RepID=UPI0028117401|nr:IS3 family transposase [Bombilactobacillus bombi]